MIINYTLFRIHTQIDDASPTRFIMLAKPTQHEQYQLMAPTNADFAHLKRLASVSSERYQNAVGQRFVVARIYEHERDIVHVYSLVDIASDHGLLIPADNSLAVVEYDVTSSTSPIKSIRAFAGIGQRGFHELQRALQQSHPNGIERNLMALLQSHDFSKQPRYLDSEITAGVLEPFKDKSYQALKYYFSGLLNVEQQPEREHGFVLVFDSDDRAREAIVQLDGLNSSVDFYQRSEELGLTRLSIHTDYMHQVMMAATHEYHEFTLGKRALMHQHESNPSPLSCRPPGTRPTPKGYYPRLFSQSVDSSFKPRNGQSHRRVTFSDQAADASAPATSITTPSSDVSPPPSDNAAPATTTTVSEVDDGLMWSMDI